MFTMILRRGFNRNVLAAGKFCDVIMEASGVALSHLTFHKRAINFCFRRQIVNIGEKCVVTFHYTLTNSDGEEIDSSAGREPLKYLHGAGNIVPGLEKELEGKTSGDKLKVEVQPEEGYGPLNPEFIQKVPRSAFEGVPEIKPGMQFQAEGPDGQTQHITVKEVSDEEITVDGNHPLAGQVLNFDVTIGDVRAASEEEVAHGHVH